MEVKDRLVAVVDRTEMAESTLRMNQRRRAVPPKKEGEQRMGRSGGLSTATDTTARSKELAERNDCMELEP